VRAARAIAEKALDKLGPDHWITRDAIRVWAGEVYLGFLEQDTRAAAILARHTTPTGPHVPPPG
jgi:hypothetical protein